MRDSSTLKRRFVRLLLFGGLAGLAVGLAAFMLIAASVAWAEAPGQVNGTYQAPIGQIGQPGQADLAARISLSDAVRTALEKNSSIGQGLTRIASSRASLVQAKADLLPDVTASISGNRQYERADELDPSARTFEGSGSASGRISSSLTLFDGFGNLNSLKSARLDLAAGEASYERTRQSVIFTISSDYLSVLESGELVKSQQDNLEAQRQRLALIEEFSRAGKRSVADVLQQQAAVAQAELDLLGAQQDESMNKLQLTADMGISPTSDYAAVAVASPEALEKSVSPYGTAPTREAVLKAALDLRPDVVAQRERVDAASTRVSVARSGWWPQISLSAGASSSYSDRDGLAGFRDQIDDNVGFSAGLSVSIPLFDRFRTATNVTQAKIGLSDEEIALSDLERSVALDVGRALLGYETAQKRHAVARAQLDYAGEALKATTARYEVGSSTLVEVTASNAQYVGARNDFVRAGYELLLGRIAVSYYEGNVDEMARVLGVPLERGTGE